MAKSVVKNDIPDDVLRRYLSPTDQGFLLSIKVKPNATKERFYVNELGEVTLSVRAVAVDNAANRRVIELLSDIFLVPKSRVELISGTTSRHKKILVRTTS